MIPCRQPGCSELLEETGFCKPHTLKRGQELQERRGNSTSRNLGYRWQRVRAKKIRMNPTCQIKTHCGPGPVLAREVDHVVPRAVRPDLAFLMSNLQSTCLDCHAAKTARDVRNYNVLKTNDLPSAIWNEG